MSITVRERRETERRKWRDQRVRESRAGILANGGDVAAWVTARLFLPRAGLRRILNSLETVSSLTEGMISDNSPHINVQPVDKTLN